MRPCTFIKRQLYNTYVTAFGFDGVPVSDIYPNMLHLAAFASKNKVSGFYRPCTDFSLFAALCIHAVCSNVAFYQSLNIQQPINYQPRTVKRIQRTLLRSPYIAHTPRSLYQIAFFTLAYPCRYVRHGIYALPLSTPHIRITYM